MIEDKTQRLLSRLLPLPVVGKGWASKPSTTSLPLPDVGEDWGEGGWLSVPAGYGVRPLKAEKLLWRKLRARQLGGVKFRKEKPIGTYIVEVVCFEHRLVLEIDGGQQNASA